MLSPTNSEQFKHAFKEFNLDSFFVDSSLPSTWDYDHNNHSNSQKFHYNKWNHSGHWEHHKTVAMEQGGDVAGTMFQRELIFTLLWMGK